MWWGIVLALVLGSAGLARAQTANAAPPPPSRPNASGAQSPAGSPLDRVISLALRDVRLEEALAEIARRGGVELQYTARVVPVDRRVTIERKDVSVRQALEDVLSGTQVAVMVTAAGKIALVRRQERRSTEQAADTVYGVVTGRVVDSASTEPLPLQVVTVDVDGETLRAVTDERGVYALLRVPAGVRKVRVRRLGYRVAEQEVAVMEGQRVRVDFALLMSMSRLQEVVMTATGPRRRYELGSDITVLNADSIVATQPVANLTELIANRVPGLAVQRSTGAPGDPSRLRLRGVSSPRGSNDPIVIVDGIRIYSNSDRNENATAGSVSQFYGTPIAAPSPLDQIDVNSIETVEVVKGPSAATLYGPDAANGVIVVTLKKGQAGPPRWTVSLEQGRTHIPGSYPDAYFALGHVPFSDTPTFCFLGTTAVCAVDEVVRYQLLNDPRYTPLADGTSSRVTVGVSGGAPALTYSLTGSVADQVGTLKLPQVAAAEYRQMTGEAPPGWMERPQGLKDWSGTTRLTARIGRSADVSVTTQLAHQEQRRSSMEQQLGTLMGTYVDPQTGEYWYSIRHSSQQATSAAAVKMPQLLADFSRRTTSASTNLTTGAAFNWRPWTWATVNASAGLHHVDRRDESLYPRSVQFVLVNQGRLFGDTTGTFNVGHLNSVVKTVNLQGAVRLPLAYGLLFQTAIGANYTGSTTGDISIASNNIPEGDPALGSNRSLHERLSDEATAGWYVEPALSHKRLFLSAGMRFDGGSTYGTNVQLFRMPKLSLSWLASDEPFFPDFLAGVFNTLRLRVAYGKAGTQPGITDRLRLYRTTNYDGNPLPVRELSTMGNTMIRPERSTEIEGGFDADMLDNRVTVELTGYRKVRHDAIVPKRLPPSVTLGSATSITLQNVSEILNTGLELGFGVIPVRSELATWSMRLNVSRNRNLVVSLGEGVDPFESDGTSVREGYPLFGYWDRPIVGYADVNGDGVLEVSEIQLGDTSVFRGATLPNYQTSINTTLGLFRNALTISAGLAYVDGLTQVLNMFDRGAFTRGKVDPSAPLAEQAAGLVRGTTYQAVSMLRFNTLSLAYRLPDAVTRRLGAAGVSLALQGTNLGLWSGYAGKDPGVGASPTGNAQVRDVGMVPQPRMWQVRINVAY